MLISFEDIVQLTVIRSKLTEVIRQLHIHRDVPGGDVDTAIKHLKIAMAEVDRSIVIADARSV